MKLWVEHDRFGKIHAVSVVDAQSPFRIVPVARAGWIVSEVDAQGLTGKPGSATFTRGVQRFMKAWTVEVGEARLVKKSGQKKGRGKKR
jgi:hypothetical protein